MPWKEVKPMDDKIRFIADYLNQYFTVTELCERYNISRKTGYKWIKRYYQLGPDALSDRSRKPHHSPTKTDTKTENEILKIRKRHHSWGAKKILWRIAKDHPDWKLPANSTVYLILKKHGYIKKRRRSRKRFHPGKPVRPITRPNDTWTVDFKGQFKTKDGIYCYPLTIADGFSRYLLACEGLLSTKHIFAKPVFKRIFQEYGLPNKIRSDNGNPFASIALGRLSRLSIWWIRLGILPELIELGHPEQNGSHERMHRTLKQETIIPPAKNLKKQQERFDTFQNEYNNQRPHEGINMKTPAEIYSLSQRKLPKKLPQVEYPAHFEVRLVSENSGIRWRRKGKNGRVCVSHLLAGEYVGLEEVDNEIWNVYFGPIWLGRLDERIMRIIDKYGNSLRKKRAKTTKNCNPCP
ncbi:MAG: IS481 family transposase [Candidatus Marinimicrobia bacterium]|nr:IS481 family transposase [Candidatus Neomarinimicrobiota bacterium]